MVRPATSVVASWPSAWSGSAAPPSSAMAPRRTGLSVWTRIVTVVPAGPKMSPPSSSWRGAIFVNAGKAYSRSMRVTRAASIADTWYSGDVSAPATTR